MFFRWNIHKRKQLFHKFIPKIHNSWLKFTLSSTLTIMKEFCQSSTWTDHRQINSKGINEQHLNIKKSKFFINSFLWYQPVFYHFLFLFFIHCIPFQLSYLLQVCLDWYFVSVFLWTNLNVQLLLRFILKYLSFYLTPT